MPVAEALKRWPQTARVFIEHRTACVGCYLAQFCTLADVAATYRLPPGELLASLEKAAQTNQSVLTRSRNEAEV
jgi:hybrid cluster-associated redox disulfide protein